MDYVKRMSASVEKGFCEGKRYINPSTSTRNETNQQQLNRKAGEQASKKAAGTLPSLSSSK